MVITGPMADELLRIGKRPARAAEARPCARASPGCSAGLHRDLRLPDERRRLRRPRRRPAPAPAMPAPPAPTTPTSSSSTPARCARRPRTGSWPGSPSWPPGSGSAARAPCWRSPAAWPSTSRARWPRARPRSTSLPDPTPTAACPSSWRRPRAAEGAVVDVALDKAETYEGLSGAAGGDGVSGFVTIQRGCDKFCTFCVVPVHPRPRARRPRRARSSGKPASSPTPATRRSSSSARPSTPTAGRT